jgi:hypothetical protein
VGLHATAHTARRRRMVAGEPCGRSFGVRPRTGGRAGAERSHDDGEEGQAWAHEELGA